MTTLLANDLWNEVKIRRDRLNAILKDLKSLRSGKHSREEGMRKIKHAQRVCNLLAGDLENVLESIRDNDDSYGWKFTDNY